MRGNDLTGVAAALRERPELAGMQMSYGDERQAIHFAVMHRLPEMTRLLMRHGANARSGVHPHRSATTALVLAKERGFHNIAAIIEEEEPRRQEPPAVAEKRAAVGEAVVAVASGNIEWLRARHAAGKLSNTIDWSEGGLLSAAVNHNQPEILAMLLDFGFDPNERLEWRAEDSGVTTQGIPLWRCAAMGRREMAEMLLRRGANPNAEVDSSGTPVYSAYSHHQWEMVDLLRRHGGIVKADTAAIYRQTGLVRQMLEDHARGALQPGTVSNGRTLADDLLDFACSGGASEIVGMALERIDWPRDDKRWFWFLQRPLDFWNHIPWLYAGNKELSRDTYIECFRQVLARCDANVIGGFHRTVLHEVAAVGDHVTDEEAAPFAYALLDAGARTDVRDEIFLSTPLGWACRWGRLPVARALLERGADPVEANAESWARPQAWAEKMKRENVVALLRNYL